MEKFYCINPENDDVIVHTFSGKSTLEEAKKVHSELIGLFPTNYVITIPDDEAVYLLDKKSTIEVLRSMIAMLEEDREVM